MNSITQYLAHQPHFSTEHLLRLYLNEAPAGWLERNTATALLALSSEWQRMNTDLPIQAIQLRSRNLADSLHQAAHHLHQHSMIKGWRNENYGIYCDHSITRDDFSQPLCELERASFRRFGFVSRAVHINGYYADGSICIGKRAASKSIDPNHLDNLAAGGIPINESVIDCAIRELSEEASVPTTLAQQIQYIGKHRVQRNETDGTHDEILYCFDLLLPDDFTPHNTDGEVAEFFRWQPDIVVAQLNTMTWDAGWITANFIQRHVKKYSS